ncbi:MAG: WD40 repeat domain-containing protein [bacterium]|nr:WD40 repeat domain-containing protein [bacterium]
MNNTNIAIQNENETLINAIDNWWGMPRGASDQNRAGGDWVGWNIISQPHLPTMPLLCDLADADWIPFNEQELQNAINQHISYLRGIGFALIDIEWGYGAKFSLISKPEYHDEETFQPLQGEAFISITPSPDGTFMTLMVDLARTQSNPNIHAKLIQIATCELMPLFLNSLQQVQNRYVLPSQNIQQMVVMDSSLMMQFSPLTELTPEPAPEIVMNYDTSCLPPISIPVPTPTPPPLEGGIGLITIPPIESEFITLENQQQLPCVGDWCRLLTHVGDIFTYTINLTVPPYVSLESMQRTATGIVQISHTLPSYITYPNNPSWGVVGHNHSRLAFNCTVYQTQSAICYWDSLTNQFYFSVDAETINSKVQISPDGQRIIAITENGTKMNIWDLSNSQFLRVPVFESYFGDFDWSDNNVIYYTVAYGAMKKFDLSTLTSSLIMDNPSLLSYGFDVYQDNLLYWEWWNEEYTLKRSGGNFVIEHPQSWYPIHWSPRPDNRVARLIPDPNNINQKCLNVFNTNDVSLETITISDTIACLAFSGAFTWANLEVTIEQQIAELAEYGIIVYANGLPTSQPNAIADWSLQHGQAWTVEELAQILIGIRKSAKAFYMLKYPETLPSINVEKRLFKSVMDAVPHNGVDVDGFYLLRVTNAFKYGQLESQGCDAATGERNHGCTSNTYSAIAFYGNFWQVNPNGILNVEYNFVHELGHRFDNQSDTVTIEDTKLSDFYMDNDGAISVTDCNGTRVFGISFGTNDWARGGRGWGDVSFPNTFGNTFQQNATETKDPDGLKDESSEVDEAAADMFLNWVYRRITDRWSNPSIDGLQCERPSYPEEHWDNFTVDDAWRQLDEQWQGFRNIAPEANIISGSITWDYNATRFDDDTDLPNQGGRAHLSGNARYWWMEKTMLAIFSLHTNWN